MTNLKEDILAVPFTETIGDYEIRRLAIFNSNQISKDEVVERIESGRAEHDERILIVYEKQWCNIMRDGKPCEDAEK